jgi:para-nitrobenzyl esterase
MMDSWTSFARSGNPNHEEIPHWPRYDCNNRTTLLFGNEIKIENDPLRTERLTMQSLPFKYKI